MNPQLNRAAGNLFSRRNSVRMNTAPPAGATYFDTATLTCSPCESGAVNYCRTNAEVPDNENNYEWIFQSTRGMAQAVPVAAGVSDCCTTVGDAMTGMYKTTCDTEKGCGWVAGPYLTDDAMCKFTTQGATYASLEECQAANATSVTEGAEGGDWFPPCNSEMVTDCYYPNVDACMPAVFGQQRRQAVAAAAARMALTGPPAPKTCTAYVCDGAQKLDAAGRRSFPTSACRCVSYK